MTNFKDFCDATTMHGFKDFVDGKKLIWKVFWAIIVVASFFVTVYEICQVVDNYRSSPTVTQVEYKLMETYKVPRFAVCPSKWANGTKIKQLIDGKVISENALFYSASLLYTTVSQDKTNLKKGADDLTTYLKSKNTTLVDFYKSFAVDQQDIFSFMPQTTIGTIDSKVELQFAGNDKFCFLVTFANAKQALLSFVPFNMQFNFTPFAFSDEMTTTADFKYANYFRNSQHKAPIVFLTAEDKAADSSEAVELKRGTVYKMTVSAIYTEKIPLENSPCLTGMQLQKRALYSRTLCKMDCMLDKMVENHTIPCYFLGLSLKVQTSKPSDKYNICTLLYEKPVSIIPPNAGELLDLFGQQCSTICPSLCENWFFNHVMDKDLSPLVGDGSTLILLYNPINGVLYSKEVLAYSWDMFVGNIGGQLGLWMGGSIISAVQVIYFLILCCTEKMSYKRKPPFTPSVGFSKSKV